MSASDLGRVVMGPLSVRVRCHDDLLSGFLLTAAADVPTVDVPRLGVCCVDDRAMVVDLTERYGLDIGSATGLPSGTVHPILARLEGLGWVQSRWEDIDPREQGRPRRRYYLLSPTGAEAARTAVARAGRSVRRTLLRPWTA